MVSVIIQIMAKSRTRVALFGGTFDPPHIGHMVAIRQILDTKKFDEIWVVPSGVRRDKRSIAPPHDRLTMTRLLVKHAFPPLENVKVLVKSHLIKNPDAFPFTIQEVEFLQKKYPGLRFTVAVGADQAQVLQYWHNAEKLFGMLDFLILARDGRPANVHPKCRATLIDPEEAIWMSISSTQLRRRLAHGHSISGLTLLPIVRYIQKRKLYRR